VYIKNKRQNTTRARPSFEVTTEYRPTHMFLFQKGRRLKSQLPRFEHF